jgi:negative regulator of flagellin synthesis FlgM
MRIDGKLPCEGKKYVGEVSSLYELQKTKTPSLKKAKEKSDVLEISLEANEIKTLAQKTKEITTVFRNEEVQKTKEEVESGNYKVNFEALAKKLVEEIK